MKHKILIFTFLCAIFFLIANSSLAQYTYTPMEKIPGTTESISAFPDYIKAIYKFALWSVGIAALLMVSIGGFMYFSAAGNTSKLDKAKIVIRDSIFGITAVLAAYLLLYTINPDLVGVSLSGLSNLGNSASASVSFQSASPSQGTINSNFTTHIGITGNGSYTLNNLTISGIDEGSYTSSLNNNTISITVPNPQLGIYQITAIIQDQDNNSHTSENINFRIISDASQLAITNLGLNEGTVGINYSQLIQAEGGSHNYTISVSGLPTGLTFHSNNNTITGTPTQAETFQITITVNDANDGTNTIEKEFSLNVREGDYPVPPESCVSVCQDGDTKCTSSNPEISKVQYCEKHHTCWVWGSPQDCPNGQKCRNNSCGGGGSFYIANDQGYKSLYQIEPQKRTFCSKENKSGCSSGGQIGGGACGEGDLAGYPYLCTEYMTDFRKLYDFSDPKICRQVDTGTRERCDKEEYRISAVAPQEYGGFWGTCGELSASRIFIPPGTTNFNLTLYLPRDDQIAMVARYKQTPECEYCESCRVPPEGHTYTNVYEDLLPISFENDIVLDEEMASLSTRTKDVLSTQDVYQTNMGGHIMLSFGFSEEEPLSENRAGWLYIRMIPCRDNLIAGLRLSIKVDAEKYNQWFSHADWDGSGGSGSYTPPAGVHVTELDTDNKYHYLSLAPHEVRYFRFTAEVSETPDCRRGIFVGNVLTTDPDGKDVHVLVKRGSLPTLDDFHLTWDLIPPMWDCSEGKWKPEESVLKAPDLFWPTSGYVTGSSEELIIIREPMEPQDFYIMLYNDSDKRVTRQRLRVYASPYE